jgi:hypothetical protein
MHLKIFPYEKCHLQFGLLFPLPVHFGFEHNFKNNKVLENQPGSYEPQANKYTKSFIHPQ